LETVVTSMLWDNSDVRIVAMDTAMRPVSVYCSEELQHPKATAGNQINVNRVHN